MAESRNNTTSLLDLPTDVICAALPQAIVSSSDATSIMKSLSSTCTGFYSLFQSELDKRTAKQLLTYVLKPTIANLEKAKKMYTANPRLLFIESTAEEYAAGLDENLKNVHRTVKASPIRAIAGAGDRWLLKEVIETDEFKKYVDPVTKKTARELAADEINKQFPNGFDFPPSTYDFDPLIDAITHDQSLIQNDVPSDVTKELLAQFRKHFLPDIAITSGHFFNLNELVRAFEIDEQNLSPQSPWQGNQLAFFWCKVVGYFEGLVTGVVGEVISQGIKNVINGNPPKRQYDFHNTKSGNNESYFPLTDDSSSRLGFSFGVYSDYDAYGWVTAGAGWNSGLGIRYGKLMSCNSNELGQIYAALAESSQPTDNIMKKLSSTCTEFYSLFQPALDKRAAQQLLTYVLKPTQSNLEKAKKMYTANPRLLFIESTAEEYAAGLDENLKNVHRTVKASPIRAIAGAGDRWLLKEVIETDEFMKYVDPVTKKTADELAADEINKQFPNGFDFPLSTYDYEPLVDAITHDQSLIRHNMPSDATERLLAKFRKDFLPETVITSGHFFNMNELVRAFKLYDANRTPWNDNQLSLFWRQVIGYFEGLVSSVTGEVISQGTINFINDYNSPKRQYDFKNYATKKYESYFPLCDDPSCRLGLSFGVDNYGRGGCAFAIDQSGVALAHTQLMLSNISELGRIYADLAATAKPSTAYKP